jgi:F-type H+/Na+-transporting ATPase subunit alpha
MASDLIDPQTIAAALRKNVESWNPSVDREEVGQVIETGDGIARVAGLPKTMANELLEFPGGLLGVAFNLEEAEIGCIIFGEAAGIEEGDPVKQTGRILSVPVGDGFLGRAVVRSTTRGRSPLTTSVPSSCRRRTWSPASP